MMLKIIIFGDVILIVLASMFAERIGKFTTRKHEEVVAQLHDKWERQKRKKRPRFW